MNNQIQLRLAMLKMIIANSPALIAFIAALELSLSAPQYRHVLNVVESLIVGEGVKTLQPKLPHIQLLPKR